MPFNIPQIEQFIDGVPDAPPLCLAGKEAMPSCAPLSRPPPGFGATYFFPPPWIVWDRNIQKRDRYVHNYIRIREYCLR